jgi:hypothetical protein
VSGGSDWTRTRGLLRVRQRSNQLNYAPADFSRLIPADSLSCPPVPSGRVVTGQSSESVREAVKRSTATLRPHASWQITYPLDSSHEFPHDLIEQLILNQLFSQTREP